MTPEVSPALSESHRAELEHRLVAWSMETMELIYEGRSDDATRMIDRMFEAAPNDPRPYFLQARLLRERVSDQNELRQSLKPQMESIHLVLDRCIEVSEAILERDPDSLVGLLYRGWGKMFKSQLHALAFEHWSAGQAAKNGKKDIDRVLELDPNSTEAHMILGTYMYFADRLPSTLKLASFLLRIPGGDRERGLEFLEYAGERDGISRYDALAMHGAALFGFEGNLEDAIDVFERLTRRFPENARLVEPTALISLFLPQRLGSDLPRIERAVAVSSKSSASGVRESAARLKIYQAITEVLTGRIDQGRANLETLYAELPPQPDWIESTVKLLLAELYLMLGEKERAAAIHASTVKDSKLEKRLRFVLEEGAAAKPDQVNLLLRVQPLAKALYAGRVDEAGDSLAGLAGQEAIFLDFYRGEHALLQGRHDEAMQPLERFARSDGAEHRRLFPYFGRLRLAEAYRLAGDADTAAKILERAAKEYEVKDLIRHVTSARRRYFREHF